MSAISQDRYRATVAYDGTDFLGYQIQKVGRTVQGEIEKSLEKLTRSKVRISGAGRTDAGVHATGQVIAFDAVWKHSLSDLHRALNATLPADIVISDLYITDKSFHPRFNALSRSYRYTIINQSWPKVLQRRYALHIKKKLDVVAMDRAGKILLGSHDFASFGKPPQGNKTTRNILEVNWFVDGAEIIFEITANAFLYQMVRKIVGTLIKVGSGQLDVEDIKRILEACDLRFSAEPVPAHGLCLIKVTYPEKDV